MSPDLLAGRYELTERIAGGGMGQVWRGRDRVLERIVAIKTVDLAAAEATARERFRREAIATAGLSAPNIVQIYDAGVDGNTAYLVMELLAGPTLSQIIHDTGRMDINQGIHVALEVALALQTAHRIGIVHRDIKPGNVMYHHDQVKLVDFGIAQLARNLGAALTAPATALGTAAYMSPEQAAGEGATDKSDWYALGCLMTTMFTGEPPFAGDPLAIANQQINAKPPYLSERRPEIPLALDRLVAALLAKEPADRPTGEQVVEQLRQLSVDPNAGTMLLPGTPAEAGGTAVLPGGGTAVLPGAAGGFAGARRSSFGETPDEPFRPVSPQRPATPVRPAPPPPVQRPYRDDVERADTRRRSTWPIIALVVLALALGITGANFLFGGDDTPMVPGETATPVASPTAEQTTPTRAPTTTRRPTTTRPATTAAPTTTAPPQTLAPTTTEPAQPTETNGNQGNKGDRNGGDGDSGNGDEGNSGEAATTDDTGVQNAIAEVESRAARQVLSAVWTEAKFSGEPDRFIEITEQMEKRGLISKSESRALTRAAEAALDA